MTQIWHQMTKNSAALLVLSPPIAAILRCGDRANK